MTHEVALAFASLWLTYLIRSVAAYLFLWVLSKLIRNSELRSRLYGIFLAGVVAAWLGLLLLPSLSAPFASDGQANLIASAPRWSWTLNSALVTHLTTVLSCARWAYVSTLGLLSLQFCSRFWLLKTFLRASEPPSKGLSLLFESVRSDIHAPECELRIVASLRSPAATGWWRPKILLPNELVPRLEAQQVADVFRHELMHVRRRDYLWDRLATLGCYLVFFHPAGWLARRRLRWERELICDEGVVERSDDRRLEYASCLTTLASWWFLEEEIVGPVDFLSSAPSLLAARVRALMSRQTGRYSSRKKAAVGLLATTALGFVVWVVPEVAVTFPWPAPRSEAKIQGLGGSAQSITRTDRKRVSKRHKLFPPVAAPPALDSRSALPHLEFPINLPVLSVPPAVQSYEFTESASEYQARSSSSGEPDSRSAASIWDESPPPTTPRRAAKIGHVAEQAVRIGLAVVGVRIADHDHEKEH
jgi:beta-lactamase regulating signal transducer with metallopeptidase domain